MSTVTQSLIATQESLPTIQYELEIVQQIQRGRLCGLSNKDRRPLTPPLVVRVSARDGASGQSISPQQVDISYFIMSAELHRGEPGSTSPPSDQSGLEQSSSSGSSASSPEATSHPSPAQQQHCLVSDTTQNLIGSLHASGYKVVDDKNQEGVFFVFPDLSVRTEGNYTLRVTLSDLAGLISPVSPVLATAQTSQFTVTSAKRFTGMEEPTLLGIALARQGVRMPVRSKGPARGKQKTGSPEDKIE